MRSDDFTVFFKYDEQGRLAQAVRYQDFYFDYDPRLWNSFFNEVEEIADKCQAQTVYDQGPAPNIRAIMLVFLWDRDRIHQREYSGRAFRLARP